MKCERCKSKLTKGMRCSECGHRNIEEVDINTIVSYLKQVKEIKDEHFQED